MGGLYQLVLTDFILCKEIYLKLMINHGTDVHFIKTKMSEQHRYQSSTSFAVLVFNGSGIEQSAKKTDSCAFVVFAAQE